MGSSSGGSHLPRNQCLGETGQVTFLTIGLLIRKYSLVEKISMTVAILTAAVGIGLVMMEAGLHSAFEAGKVVPVDLLLGLPLACTGLFITAMKPIGTRSTKRIALFASAIYFVHPWIVHGGKILDLDFTTLTVFSVALSIPISATVVAMSRRFRFIL